MAEAITVGVRLAIEDRLIWMHRFLSKHIRSWTSKFLIGVFGFLIGAIDEKQLNNIQSGKYHELASDLFHKRALYVVVAALLPILWIAHWSLKSYASQYKLTSVLRRFEDKLKPTFPVSPSAKHFFKVGYALTIVPAPDVLNGLSTLHVPMRIDKATSEFRVPPSRLSHYRAFVPTLGLKSDGSDDGTKIMASAIKIPRTDAPSLDIICRTTKFSVVRYYQRQVLPDQIHAMLQDIQGKLEGSPEGMLELSHPHSLCAHIVIVTRDKKILTTKRSRSMSYYPSSWSASIEEQAIVDDIEKKNPTQSLHRWIERALIEELGLSQRTTDADFTENYDSEAIRLAGVFIETDTLNIALCVVVRLNISAENLDSIIKLGFTEDKEFSAWCFLDSSDAANEISNGDHLHPSTKYRLIFGMILGCNLTPMSVLTLVDQKIRRPLPSKLV